MSVGVRRPFGTMRDGAAVEAIDLAGGTTRVTIVTLGASVQAVWVPDRDGRMADVVLWPEDVAGYLAQRNCFGATIGRYANRIAGGRWRMDGIDHRASCNDGGNVLHGGAEGFDRRIWEVACADASSVTLRLVSLDGDQGFPGTLAVETTYAVDAEGTLSQVIRATTDRPTIVNCTNHSYWNLAGGGSADGHRLTVHADAFTPVDATLVPTGEVRPVAGTPFDFRVAAVVGERLREGQDEQTRLGRGYDHNWVVQPGCGGAMRTVARLEDPGSGRVLEVISDQPGLQVYSANFLDGTITGKRGQLYRMGDAICLEPQRYPDTPNRPAFGSARLDPGETYEHRLAFRFPAA